MNSKWQINRVGLLDFWYYDEEEFDFLDGRMLLRGANGSGKSVTMQSFIPLLLDGNMRPERLDPFGSRARKMENYLLEEGDDREERTGYLYMELKRLESEEYLTLGIGLRARKNKKLESWYFCVTDGRRVGKDLFLYKDVENKITCSKGELKYRIGEGGKVMETQGEYAQCVNRLLFGFEIQLYKDVENKITCSKGELKYRIGEGGKVMETQGEYAQCVNRLLFGFEIQEEYKELLELLIQLRTPKLSKDFKPTVINEILSSSLQTLSEDDLRPMSEAIENMDNLKTNLDTLSESIHAARQIERVYDQYNQIVLYDKALLFSDAGKAYENCMKNGKQITEGLAVHMEELRKEEQHYEALKQEEEILKEEKTSLDKSDAAQLKEQESKLKAELLERLKEKQTKEKQEQEKKEKQIDTEEKIKTETEKTECIWEEIQNCLEEMETELEEIPFDEFVFLKKDILQDREKEQSFSSHHQLLNDYTKKVEQGKEALLEEKNSQEKYDRCLLELDACREDRNLAEKEMQQYENLLHETKSELTEQVYLWEKQNQELHLLPETMQEIKRKIESYEMGSDYSEIRELTRLKLYELERQFSENRVVLERNLREEQEHLYQAETELEEWKNQKDPEPEQPDCVKANRELLKEKKIPYFQFYKTIEFDQILEEERRNHLEEALLEMGVLDALIVPEEYREQVYALDKGVCDRYLFSDVAHVRENLQRVLEVENGENDILFYQNISNVLSSIGFGDTHAERGESWIDANGNYRIGVLEGTITGEYQARFIGVHAREKYRKEKIEELTRFCEQLRVSVEGLEKQLAENRARTEKLKGEWKSFPGEEDLKTAAKEFSDREYKLERKNKRLWEQQELAEKERKALDEVKSFPGEEDLKTAAKEFSDREYKLERKNKRLWEQQELAEKERKALDEVRIRVREICGKCYLSPRLDLFTQALLALHRYKEILSQLQVAHGKYQNSLRYITSQRDYLEELELDLDDIRYELNRICLKVREVEGFLASVQKQLELTDYEEIKERLDHCVERLGKLPGEREVCVRNQAALRKEMEVLQEKERENELRQKELLEKKEKYQNVFEQEYQLRYVERAFVVTDDMEDQAKKICSQFAGSFGNKKQSDLFGNLQEAYHQNRGYLLDYQITLQSLFEELDAEGSFLDVAVKRIDILAKYRGIPVKFKELIEKMNEDAEVLKRLLSDRDRELFEDISGSLSSEPRISAGLPDHTAVPV